MDKNYIEEGCAKGSKAGKVRSIAIQSPPTPGGYAT
jgi:hypothetical protein